MSKLILISGVLKLTGNSSNNSEHDLLLLETISKSLAAVYNASSNPYQRSLKNIWPDISPASAAFVSFNFFLIKLWPVLDMIGSPPLSEITLGKSEVHLTSKIIFAPLLRVRTSLA